MEKTNPEKDSDDEKTTSESTPTDIKSQPQSISHECKICGAAALHSNYGAMTCSPCKMFFRRNATTDRKLFLCVADGECEININNRHVCSSCRLDKCFANGMQTELIRSRLSRRNGLSRNVNVTPTLNILTTTSQHTEGRLLPTINLLQSDNSTLTANQWTLLSNLIYSYDETKLLSIAQKITNKQDGEMINPTLAEEFFTKAYETCGAYIRSNSDISTLSSDDRSDFLRNTANNVFCLGMVLCYNLSQLCNCKYFINVCTNVYGENAVIMVRQVLKFIDSDIVISKLALSIFAFCINNIVYSSNITMNSLNTLAIFRIQNTYVEVLWKYLVYKYGYYESIQRFMKLIQYLLAGTEAVFESQTIEKHVNDIESLIEQTELALVLDDIERIEENKKN